MNGTATQEMQRHQMILRAVQLRERGKSYRAIAKALAVDVATAYRYVWAHFDELDSLASETLERVRKLELSRLDRYLLKLDRIMANRIDPDLTVKAVLASVKVAERRARLSGLDAPTKVDMRDVTKEPTDKLTSRAKELLAKLEEQTERVH